MCCPYFVDFLPRKLLFYGYFIAQISCSGQSCRSGRFCGTALMCHYSSLDMYPFMMMGSSSEIAGILGRIRYTWANTALTMHWHRQLVCNSLFVLLYFYCSQLVFWFYAGEARGPTREAAARSLTEATEVRSNNARACFFLFCSSVRNFCAVVVVMQYYKYHV